MTPKKHTPTLLFLTDDDFANNLANLWETVVSPLDTVLLPVDEKQTALTMLNDIAQAKTGIGSEVVSHRLTSKALRLKQVIEGFREKQKAVEQTPEPQGFNEAEKQTVSNAKADGVGLTKAEQKAVAWYDNVEKALLGLVKRIQNDATGAFVGGDDGLFMRRVVGTGALMAITSPSVPVKQNVLMTMLGTVVAENALNEVFQEYRKQQGKERTTFRQFVEDIVNHQNHQWFRRFLDAVEEKIQSEDTEGKNVTSFLISGREYSATKPQTKKETPITEYVKSQGTEEPFVAIVPPTKEAQANEQNKTITVKLNLGDNQTVHVQTNNSFTGNLRKGILIYVDALATPELGDVDPYTKEPTVQAKWQYNDFAQFYTGTLKEIQSAKTTLPESAGQRLEELGSAFIKREKLLRFGKKITDEAKTAETAPIGSPSTFGNAVRDFYVTHFGSEATKVKSFGLSVVFKTLADKLGIGSSVLPSVVYDVWMNANIHNMLREAEESVNPTGMPNAERVKALQQKYREALLPYGFDVDLTYDAENGIISPTVKDYANGKIYQYETTAVKNKKNNETQREKRTVTVKPMEGTDKITFDAIDKANENSYLRRIREEWNQKRMFFASEQTENIREKASRVTNLTRVFLRRRGEEWHSVFQAGDESAGELVLKELDRMTNHFMGIKYDQDGNVYLMPQHPLYQRVQNAAKNKELQTLFDGVNPVSIEDIYQNGKKEITVGNNKTKKLWDEYKTFIDKLREGGVPMAFGEQIMKNAMYVNPNQPMEPRKLQALLWVCSRGAV